MWTDVQMFWLVYMRTSHWHTLSNTIDSLSLLGSGFFKVSWGVCHEAFVMGTESNHLQQYKWIFWLVTAIKQCNLNWNQNWSFEIQVEQDLDFPSDVLGPALCYKLCWQHIKFLMFMFWSKIKDVMEVKLMVFVFIFLSVFVVIYYVSPFWRGSYLRPNFLCRTSANLPDLFSL